MKLHIVMRRAAKLAVWVAALFYEHGQAAESSPPAPLPLRPVYQLISSNGLARWSVDLPQPGSPAAETNKVEIAYFAVVGREWPAGLIPVFAVEGVGRFELCRRPPTGRENLVEPLCFILPPEDDPVATKLAGRWDVLATRGDGSKTYLGWEFATDREHVAARFDQNTDYRFAQIEDGIFLKDRLTMRVQYIQDGYALAGEWRDGRLSGTWRQVDDSERGVWEASRPPVKLPVNSNVSALFEWRRAADRAVRYGLDGRSPGPDWTRAARPLGRVWPAPRTLSRPVPDQQRLGSP